MIRGNDRRLPHRMLRQYDAAKKSILSRALEPYFQAESSACLEEFRKGDEFEQNAFLSESHERAIVDYYYETAKRMGRVLLRKLTEYSEYYDANAQSDVVDLGRTYETGRIHDIAIAWDVAHAIKPELDKATSYTAMQSFVSSDEITKKILQLEVAAEENKQLIIDNRGNSSGTAQPEHTTAPWDRTFSLSALGSDELEG